LDEIIAEAKGVQKGSISVERDYRLAVAKFGSEFAILLKVPREDLFKGLSDSVAEGIMRVREGKVHIQPGFDGEYGKISIFGDEPPKQKSEQQLSLF
jgi:PHP family Zn ribbon phosphoesterase